jgi:hypothetical protein
VLVSPGGSRGSQATPPEVGIVRWWVFEDIDLPSPLQTLDPKARDKVRRVLIRGLIDFLILHQGGTAEGAALAR